MTPWTAAHQAPLSMEFSRQEYWSGLSFPSPGDHPDSGIEPGSPALQVDSFVTNWVIIIYLLQMFVYLLIIPWIYSNIIYVHILFIYNFHFSYNEHFTYREGTSWMLFI